MTVACHLAIGLPPVSALSEVGGDRAQVVTVRPVAPAEYGRVADLTLAAYAQLGFELGPYRDELADVAGRATDAEVLIAVDDAGVVLGAVTYVPHRDSASAEFTDDDAAGMRMLAVDPAAQGRGIGARLVDACIARAAAAGRARIVLHTTEAMQTAQRMYRRLGFQRAEDRDWRPQPHVALLGYQLPVGRVDGRS